MRFGLYAGVRPPISFSEESLSLRLPGLLCPRCGSDCTSLPRATQLLFQQCLYRSKQCVLIHPHQSRPPFDLLDHAGLTESLLRSPSASRDRAAMGKGLVCVSFPHTASTAARFAIVLWHASADVNRLTETALAMTIFRDEGRFPPSSRAVAAFHKGKVLTRRRLRPNPQISLQTVGVVIMHCAYSRNR